MSAKKFRSRLWQFSLPVLVLAAGVGAGSVVINSKPEPAQTDAGPVLRSVNTVVAEAQPLSITVSSQGTVEPYHQITLVPQVSGTITWVSDRFVNGGRFAAGETLLKIDPRDYTLAVTSAEATVADALQQLATARAQVEQAEAEWAMLKREQAPRALALHKPQLASAEAQLLSAQAELQRAQLQLERTEITAPFAGMLTGKLVDYGQFLSAGTDIAQLVSSDVLEVRLALPERELANLDLSVLASGKAAASVIVGALSGDAGSRWHGRLVRSEGLIDPLTRNLVLVAQFTGSELTADDGGMLTIGQFVRADIAGRRFDDVFRLPRTALHNATSVYVIDTENRLRQRQVDVLEINDDHILVASGLQSGEIVSISPLTSSVEGQQVQMVSMAPIAQPVAGDAVSLMTEGAAL